MIGPLVAVTPLPLASHGCILRGVVEDSSFVSHEDPAVQASATSHGVELRIPLLVGPLPRASMGRLPSPHLPVAAVRESVQPLQALVIKASLEVRGRGPLVTRGGLAALGALGMRVVSEPLDLGLPRPLPIVL